MCGRFGATFQYSDIKVRWNLYGDLSGFSPRYNIAPSQDVPVIVRNEGRNQLKPMRPALRNVDVIIHVENGIEETSVQSWLFRSGCNGQLMTLVRPHQQADSAQS